MSYRVDHIQLRGPDPRKTAQWYVQHVGARILGEEEARPGFLVIRLDLGGTSFHVSGSPTGQPLPQGTTDFHWGLEHFGLETDDLEGTVARLQAAGVEVLRPITASSRGTRFAFVRAPDDVLLEFVQPAA